MQYRFRQGTFKQCSSLPLLVHTIALLISCFFRFRYSVEITFWDKLFLLATALSSTPFSEGVVVSNVVELSLVDADVVDTSAVVVDCEIAVTE